MEPRREEDQTYGSNSCSDCCSKQIQIRTMEIFKFALALIVLLTMGTTMAVDTSTDESTKGRGRGAGLAERMRQRKQRREDERNAKIQDRRTTMRKNEGEKLVGRQNPNVAQKISEPLKKRLEEMRNRRKSEDEL